MPELPEVEEAAQRLRRALEGRRITAVRLLHPSLRKRLPAATARTIRDARVMAVARRGKHQLIRLADGRTLHAHFRMNGDWLVDRATDPLPRFARATIDLDDGARVVLVDSRALATLTLHDVDEDVASELGPEADDPSLTPERLARALTRRRIAIKPVLLDQRIIAGIGNIYAAEALWRARIDPFTPANGIDERACAALLRAIRAVIRRATGGRYQPAPSQQATASGRLDVYDREGKPCRRCRTPIARAVQAGRSTYYCPTCQR